MKKQTRSRQRQILTLSGEAVELDEVVAQTVDVGGVVAVVDVGGLLAVEVGVDVLGAGSQEDADDGAGLLVGGDLDLVGEGLVVEAHGLGDVVDLVHLLNGGEVDGVADVHVEEVEVGDELVDGNVLDGDAGEGEVLGAVVGQLLLVLLEEAHDVAGVVVEGGVAQGGLVVAHDAGGDAVLHVGVHDEGEQVAQHGGVGGVVAGVDGVGVTLDQVAQDVDAGDVVGDGHLVAVLAVHEAGVDGLLDAVLDGLEVVHGVRLDGGQGHVVGAGGEVGAGVVGLVSVVAVGHGLLPVEVVHLGQVVGHAVQVVVGQQLLVEVVEGLSAELAGVDAVLVAVHPEGHVQVGVGVEGVEASVLGPVAQHLLGLADLVATGPVGHLDVGVDVLHLGAVEVGQVGGLEVQLGVDLVHGGQHDALGVGAVDDGHGQSVHELALVDVVAGPGGGADEGVKVLGEVEQVEQGDGLLQVGVVVHVEDLAAGQGTLLPHPDEVLDDGLVGVLVQVLFGVPGLAQGDELGVHVLLVDIAQQLQDVLLLQRHILRSCEQNKTFVHQFDPNPVFRYNDHKHKQICIHGKFRQLVRAES